MGKTRVGVIGSGFGGLSCAIRLQAAGFEVTILEKRPQAGGRAYVYRDQGFTFDAGPTVITAPHCLEELFEVAGRRMENYVELMPVSPLYRLHWEDGTKFDYTADLTSTLEQIEKLSPPDAKVYKQFLDYTEEVFEAGYTKLAHVPFLSWGSMLKVAPQLMKLEAYRSVYSIVSKYIKHPHLRQAFSFHSLLVGGNPFSASAIYTLIHFLERKWGVFFAKGGTNALVAGMLKLFEDQGGKFLADTEISEIATKDGKVTGVKTLDGRDLPFDAVVSNADVARTYLDLLKRESALDGTRKKMASSHYSMSLFLLYFGTNRQYDNLAHHNVIFGHRYKELLKDIFERGIVADDFSLYLHAPSRTDKSLAPEGGEAFYALSPVPHLGKSSVDWEEFGPKYADKILSYLETHYLPGLKASIVTQKIFTPQNFQTELNAHLGSAFSLEPRLTQSAYFRVHNRDPHIQGLYFVGAGTHPGAGIPGVVGSAKATAGLIIEDLAGKTIEVRERAAEKGLPALVEECQRTIKIGSKSFSMASRLFGVEARNAAFLLYAWCRYCDDQIDDTINLRLQEARVLQLKQGTRAAFSNEVSSEAPFEAMRHLSRSYRIPEVYAEELIEGMAMDVRRERYETIEELQHYCYRVAGTVGLMMVHVMGVSEELALSHASDLGTAMQLTNIARDVVEDANRGRVYLPLHWLDEEGVPEGQIGLAKYRVGVANVVRRVLREADRYYESGAQGLKYLPWRAALAVAVASQVYRQIGVRVEARGDKAWDTRTVVSKFGKAVALVRGMGMVLATVPHRLIHPWRRVSVTLVWRYST